MRSNPVSLTPLQLFDEFLALVSYLEILDCSLSLVDYKIEVDVVMNLDVEVQVEEVEGQQSLPLLVTIFYHSKRKLTKIRPTYWNLLILLRAAPLRKLTHLFPESINYLKHFVGDKLINLPLKLKF